MSTNNGKTDKECPPVEWTPPISEDDSTREDSKGKTRAELIDRVASKDAQLTDVRDMTYRNLKDLDQVKQISRESQKRLGSLEDSQEDCNDCGQSYSHRSGLLKKLIDLIYTTNHFDVDSNLIFLNGDKLMEAQMKNESLMIEDNRFANRPSGILEEMANSEVSFKTVFFKVSDLLVPPSRIHFKRRVDGFGQIMGPTILIGRGKRGGKKSKFFDDATKQDLLNEAGSNYEDWGYIALGDAVDTSLPYWLRLEVARLFVSLMGTSEMDDLRNDELLFSNKIRFMGDSVPLEN